MQNMSGLRERAVDLGKLLTTADAARVAVCSPATIRRAAAEGRLRAMRLGSRGDFRVPADELARWMRAGTESDA
jgi:excisionase family DNA binding protein